MPKYEHGRYICPVCNSNDNVALVCDSDTAVMWCKCGLVFIRDMKIGKDWTQVYNFDSIGSGRE